MACLHIDCLSATWGICEFKLTWPQDSICRFNDPYCKAYITHLPNNYIIVLCMSSKLGGSTTNLGNHDSPLFQKMYSLHLIMWEVPLNKIQLGADCVFLYTTLIDAFLRPSRLWPQFPYPLLDDRLHNFYNFFWTFTLPPHLTVVTPKSWF